MAVHRGKILKKVLKEQGVSPTWLSRKRKVDRTTVYNWFDRKDLDLDVLISIGQDIHYDFSRNIPELSGVTMASEPEAPYGNKQVSLSECLRQRDEWKQKYYDLLERFVNKDK